MKIRVELYIPDELGLTGEDLVEVKTAMMTAAMKAAVERVLWWKRLLAFIRQEA